MGTTTSNEEDDVKYHLISDTKPRCDICDKEAKLMCGECSKRMYCSVECQKIDWYIKFHYKKCKQFSYFNAKKISLVDDNK